MKKYKIVATKEQLEDIGIDYDIDGLIATYIDEYSSGYYKVSVSHKTLGRMFINTFDIPKQYLKEI